MSQSNVWGTGYLSWISCAKARPGNIIFYNFYEAKAFKTIEYDFIRICGLQAEGV
jgi:hypothetical protein